MVDDQNGDTALHLASDRGSAACINALLDAGAHINAQNNVSELSG